MFRLYVNNSFSIAALNRLSTVKREREREAAGHVTWSGDGTEKKKVMKKKLLLSNSLQAA